jgi:hypothetical protein
MKNPLSTMGILSIFKWRLELTHYQDLITTYQSLIVKVPYETLVGVIITYIIPPPSTYITAGIISPYLLPNIKHHIHNNY